MNIIEKYTDKEHVAVLARPSVTKQVSESRKDLPLIIDPYEKVDDAVGATGICLIVDGDVFKYDADDVSYLEQMLTSVTTELMSCEECEDFNEDGVDPIQCPLHNIPVILLHQEELGEFFEKLVPITPPMVVTEIFSEEFKKWLVSMIELFHHEALLFRVDCQKWLTLNKFRKRNGPEAANEMHEGSSPKKAEGDNEEKRFFPICEGSSGYLIIKISL